MPKFKTKSEWTFNWRGLDELCNRFDQAKQRIERLTEELKPMPWTIELFDRADSQAVTEAVRFCLSLEGEERLTNAEHGRVVGTICREYIQMKRYIASQNELDDLDEITLRDYLAAKAMAVVNEQNLAPTPLHSEVARDAYALADAMLAERRKAVEQTSTKEVSNPSG